MFQLRGDGINTMSDKAYGMLTASHQGDMRLCRHPRIVFAHSITVRSGVVQGFFVGFGLALVTFEMVARIKIRKVNGRITFVRMRRARPRHVDESRARAKFPGP
jgi:hypothetical protein